MCAGVSSSQATGRDGIPHGSRVVVVVPSIDLGNYRFLPPVAGPAAIPSVLARGSTVRVRQRALQSAGNGRLRVQTDLLGVERAVGMEPFYGAVALATALQPELRESLRLGVRPRRPTRKLTCIRILVRRRKRFAPTAPSSSPSTVVWRARLSPDERLERPALGPTERHRSYAPTTRASATRTYSSLMSRPMHRRFNSSAARALSPRPEAMARRPPSPPLLRGGPQRGMHGAPPRVTPQPRHTS